MRVSVDKETGEVIRRIRYPFERLRVLTEQVGPSMTVNAFKDETDINNIVNRFSRTGLLPPTEKQGYFVDVTELQGDLTERYQASQDILAKASDNDLKLAEHREAKRKSVEAKPVPEVKPDLVPDKPAT